MRWTTGYEVRGCKNTFGFFTFCLFINIFCLSCASVFFCMYLEKRQLARIVSYISVVVMHLTFINNKTIWITKRAFQHFSVVLCFSFHFALSLSLSFCRWHDQMRSVCMRHILCAFNVQFQFTPSPCFVFRFYLFFCLVPFVCIRFPFELFIFQFVFIGHNNDGRKRVKKKKQSYCITIKLSCANKMRVGSNFFYLNRSRYINFISKQTDRKFKSIYTQTHTDNILYANNR